MVIVVQVAGCEGHTFAQIELVSTWPPEPVSFVVFAVAECSSLFHAMLGSRLGGS